MNDLRKTSLTIYVPTRQYLLRSAVEGILTLSILWISSLIFPMSDDWRDWWIDILKIFGWMFSLEIYYLLRRKLNKKAELPS